MVTLGVISDTHIPDHVPALHAGIVPFFKKAGVLAILHAGDVCVQRVLDELAEVAPVYAVKGNRDIFALRHLPRVLHLTFEGANILLVHGHEWRRYVADKGYIFLHGLDDERFIKRLLQKYPEPHVIVYGHTHLPYAHWRGSQLLFNPGSACCPMAEQFRSTLGLLHINSGQRVEAELVHIDTLD